MNSTKVSHARSPFQAVRLIKREGRRVVHVRKFLGQRLRSLRQERGWSQRKLGQQSGLSGKFIGEVERGEKSISIDSLYGVSVALKVPLRVLTDAPPDDRSTPTEESERIFALVQNRSPEDLRKALSVLRSIFVRRTRAAAS